MNAREVYELLDGCPFPERLEYVKEGHASQMIRPHGWYFGKYPIPPAQALDLIVGAMKREMGDAWKGAWKMEFVDGAVEWVAYCDDGKGFQDVANTEPAAVIAAWRAWKEAGK